MRIFSILSTLVLSALSCFAQPPIAVPTPHGDFQFNAKVTDEKCVDLSWGGVSGNMAKVTGDIINNTDKDWVDLGFTLSYIDEKGLEFSTPLWNKVFVGTLKKGGKFVLVPFRGGVVSLDLSSSQRTGTLNCRQFHIARIGIKLTKGTIPAKYTFVILKKTEPEQPIKTPTKTSGRAPVTASPKAAVSEIVESSDLSFVDSNVEFRFSLSKEQFGFVLRNTSEEPIEIDWNQVAYVDVTGESHKVIHKGIKLDDRDKLLVPTTIPPSARIEDIVVPTDYIYFVEHFGEDPGGWQHRLFPDGDKAALYKGQTFTVFMPMKVNGTVKNYTFKFRIVEVEV